MSSTRTNTHTLLDTLIRTFADYGVQFAASSPGSRSAPLLAAILREKRITSFSHIDERSGGFFALGTAKTTDQPALLICTSGTAAANYLPAIVEAFQARVPLIVLTADRPTELRDVGAGQTIDQMKLYGSAVKEFHQLELSDDSQQTERWMKMFAYRVFHTTVDGRPGPVHVNIPLRSPLLPSEVEERRLRDSRPSLTTHRSRLQRQPVDNRSEWLEMTISPTQDGVLVAGRQEFHSANAVKQLATYLGWPLLAEPTSGARDSSQAIAHYDTVVTENPPTPKVVVRIGDLPTSKNLRQWLASLPATTTQIALDPERAWQDPAGAVKYWFDLHPQTLFETLQQQPKQPVNTKWFEQWQQLDTTSVTRTTECFVAASQITKEHAVHTLGQELPADTNLIAASSQAVRLVERFFPARQPIPQVLSNRGANGIDGTIATAFGVRAASSKPTFVLLGDVAFLHDIGSLATAVRTKLAITIIVLNDNGGGIFLGTEAAPNSYLGESYCAHTLTPHGLSFAASAQQFGCGYEAVHTASELATALQKTLQSAQTTIIEVHVPPVS